MDCTASLSPLTLIRSAIAFQPSTLCGSAFIGGKEIGSVVAMDCTSSEQSWKELLFAALFEGDSAVGTDVVDGTLDEIAPLNNCSPDSLETLFRRALILGADGTKVKVFRTEGDRDCPDCDESPTNLTPARTRMLGAFVAYRDEVRIHVRQSGWPPDAITLDCDRVALDPMVLIAGALSYDQTSRTWYWNTSEI